MLYNDSIYGAVDIAEPVLQDLVQSQAVQRLKGVSQHGITALLGMTPAFTRFDHSVGVMILVRSLGATLEEQLAALLHDVSHTAFSHVIDFVFGDHDGQSYHDKKKYEFIEASDIPGLLSRHGFDWRDFVDEDPFTLLEQSAPALCADRLDYFFRDLKDPKLATTDNISAAVNALMVERQRIVVNDLQVARWLAYSFIEMDRMSWSNFREVGLYQLTAEAIRKSWDLGLIGEDELWGADSALWEKLLLAQHREVKEWVDLISPATGFTWDEHHPTFCISTKIRTIDPDVVVNGACLPLSVLDEEFSQYRHRYVQSKQGLWPMRVVPDPCNSK